MIYIFVQFIPDFGAKVCVGECLHAAAGLWVVSAGPVEVGILVQYLRPLFFLEGSVSYMVHDNYLTRAEHLLRNQD